MKIAVPVWQGNVSNVFDFAQNLLVVEIENDVETGRNERVLAKQNGLQRVAKLKQLEVNVLICGAISRSLAYMLSSSGIDVLPFVTGSIERILTAYKTGNLSLPEYAMPGCWRGARRGFGRRRGRCGRRQ